MKFELILILPLGGRTHCAHFPIKHGAAASRRAGEEGRLQPIGGWVVERWGGGERLIANAEPVLGGWRWRAAARPMRCDRYRCDIQRTWRRRNSAESGELRCYVWCNMSLARWNFRSLGSVSLTPRRRGKCQPSPRLTWTILTAAIRKLPCAVILFRLSEALQAPWIFDACASKILFKNSAFEDPIIALAPGHWEPQTRLGWENVNNFTYHWSVHVPECSFLAVENFPLDFVSLLVDSDWWEWGRKKGV